MAANLDFKGKVVLITGAGSGIGAATAILFYKLGATLSITDINEAGLNSTSQECLESDNGQPKPFLTVGDIASDEFRKEFIEKSVKTFGKIDVLVNNAGIAPKDTFETTSLEVMDKVLSINFRAPYHLTLLATEHLKQSKGNIVNISSCSSKMTAPSLFSYSITKAAVDRLTQASAAALGKDGVRVNSVNPGTIQTELYKQTIGDVDIKPLIEHFISRNALPQMGQAVDIARVVVFLASEYAGFVTGINMLADGGLTIKYH